MAEAVSSCATCDAPCDGAGQPPKVVEHYATFRVRSATVDASNAHLARYGHIGGSFTRPMRIEGRGNFHEGHAHRTSHLTLIKRGPVLVEWWNPETDERGEIRVMVDDCKLWLPAKVHHKFVALGDVAEWECVFFRPEDPGDITEGSFHQEVPGG